MTKIKTFESLDLQNKKVLLRVDLNVPMKDGAITETSRIEKIIPTIKLLMKKQAKIITLNGAFNGLIFKIDAWFFLI